MSNLSEKAQAFLAKKPEYFGEVAGHNYYECPINGDESPMRVITKEGKLKTSSFWDMDSVRDFGDEFES